MTEPRPLEDFCSLPEDQLAARRERVREEILPHARRSQELADGLAWEFDAALLPKLEQLVALERQCCPGLSWELQQGLRSGAVRLELRGLDPGAEGLAGMRVPPRPAPAWRRPLARLAQAGARLAQAGGLAAAGAFLLFCVAPLGLAAVAGAAVAAPFARLDDPRALAAGSLVFGAGAWLLLRRRARKPAAKNAACGC